MSMRKRDLIPIFGSLLLLINNIQIKRPTVIAHSPLCFYNNNDDDNNNDNNNKGNALTNEERGSCNKNKSAR